jgi:transcriptional regulator with XRE-family HTH domain
MKVGELLRLWRNVKNIGIRDMAAEIGVSAATLSRLERGENVDGKTLIKLIAWIFEVTP